MHYAKLYAQNGNRIMTIESVTSLHLMHKPSNINWSQWMPPCGNPSEKHTTAHLCSVLVGSAG